MIIGDLVKERNVYESQVWCRAVVWEGNCPHPKINGSAVLAFWADFFTRPAANRRRESGQKVNIDN